MTIAGFRRIADHMYSDLRHHRANGPPEDATNDTPPLIAGSEVMSVAELREIIFLSMTPDCLQRMRGICRTWRNHIDGGQCLLEAQYLRPPVTGQKPYVDGIGRLAVTVNPLLNCTFFISRPQNSAAGALLDGIFSLEEWTQLSENIMLAPPRPQRANRNSKSVTRPQNLVQHWAALSPIEEALMAQQMQLLNRPAPGPRQSQSEWGASWKSRLFCMPPVSEVMIADARTGWGFRCYSSHGPYVLLGDIMGMLEEMDMFYDPGWLAAQPHRSWELEIHVPLYDGNGNPAPCCQFSYFHRSVVYGQLTTKLRVRLGSGLVWAGGNDDDTPDGSTESPF